MERSIKGEVQNFLWYASAGFLVVLVGTFVTIRSNLFATATGYLLSFIFVGSNFFIINRIKGPDTSKFYRQFFISLAVRFCLVLVAYVVILEGIKIHQIYFTVSFIISYIFHSVIEIISINKILESDN